ncbi:hypothetical protein Tco_0363894 [Tanacetum coccineum]
MSPGNVAKVYLVPKPDLSLQQMSTDIARGHGDDGGSDDCPPTYHIPIDCGGCFINRGKGTRKPNLGGRKADAILLEASHAIPALGRYQCRHTATSPKVVQYQQGFPQGNVLGYKPRDPDLRCGDDHGGTSQEHYPGRLGFPDCLLE